MSLTMLADDVCHVNSFILVLPYSRKVWWGEGLAN